MAKFDDAGATTPEGMEAGDHPHITEHQHGNNAEGEDSCPGCLGPWFTDDELKAMEKATEAAGFRRWFHNAFRGY